MSIGVTIPSGTLGASDIDQLLRQQAADTAAQIAYSQAQAAGLSAAAATNAAAEKWKEVYDAATLTGMYNGQPTLAAADLYGYSGGASGTGVPTRAEVGQQNQNALDLLKIGAGLRGPQNYFQYSKVLNGTPQGLRDILSAAAGNLRIPGFGGGLTGTAATTPGGGTPQAIGPNGQLNVQAAASSPLPASSPLAPHTAAPLEAASLAGMASDIANPSQTAPYAGYAKDLVNPNQIDPRAWANFSPTQKSLDLGAYEAGQGWDPNDVQALFNKSLPQYGGATRGQVAGMFPG